MTSSIERSEEYQEVLDSFSSRSVLVADRPTLERYLFVLAQNTTGNDAVQSRDIVQSGVLNSLLLQRHIKEVERRADVTQRFVIALAVASLVGTAVQCWYTVQADRRDAQRSSVTVLPVAGPMRRETVSARPGTTSRVVPNAGSATSVRDTSNHPADQPTRTDGAGGSPAKRF